MKNKKWLLSLLTLLFCVVSAFAFTSCGEQETKSYTVTFYTDGGSEVAPQTVEKGEKVERPQTPTKEGYLFLGWYCEGEEWSFVGYPVTEDITLKARWREDSYGYTFEEYYNDFYQITGCYLFENELVLPTMYNGKQVRKIADGAFKNCEYLYSVSIPKNIDEIGARAFEDCDNLSKVEVAFGVRSIGNDAFKDCDALTSIEFPVGTTVLDAGVFEGCKNLQTVKLAENLTYLSYRLFYGCERLTDVVLPDRITEIGAEAFYGCKSLTGMVIPKDVTSIGDNAFYGCFALTELVLSGCLTEIGENAFYGCYGVKELFIPNCVQKIGNYAFFYCSLESVIIPDSVIEIGENVFIAENSVTVYCEKQSQPSGWNEVWWGDEQLTNKSIVYWYSETQPTQEGNYWRYENGIPTVWE